MIACKRGRVSVAVILIFFAVFYFFIFMFPASFIGLVIQPEANVFVMNELVESFENQTEVPVIITLKNDLSVQDNVLSDFDEGEFDLRYQYTIINAFSGKITERGVEKLRKNPSVKGIYLDEKAELLLNNSASLINATSVWQIKYNGVNNLTGKGISVCLIDTGINYSHPALAGKVIAGYNFANNSVDYMDDHGHGTNIAGIVASNDAVYRGIAPDANLVAMKASLPSEVIEAIQWCLYNATKYNISIISISMGFGISGNQTECDEHPVAEAANKAKAKNILFVAAAGNEGVERKNMLAIPACASNVTSASAVLNDDSICEKSQTAEFLDLFAPGYVKTTNISGGFSAVGCGTSIAAPHVAGAAALIYQYEKMMGLNATPDEVGMLFKTKGKMICETLYKDGREDSPYCRYFPRLNVLYAINAVLIANISDSSLSNSHAKVKFNSQTDLTEASSAFELSYNLISLNSSYQKFNKSATLTLYNLAFEKQPIAMKNGQICSDCLYFPYNGNFTFIVSSFTNYSASANSQMQILDSHDYGPYFSGNLTARVNQTVYFFSNYTNRTSGQTVSSGSCNITFDDSSGLMWFNETKNLFEYSRNFSFIGDKWYSISCNSSDFETILLQDSVWVSGCVYPGANINWTINESTGSVYCKFETLLINNTDITVQDGYSLILENTNLTIVATSNKINVSTYANLTITNSNINGQPSSILSIFNLGRINISDSTLNYTRLSIDGNSTNYLDSSIFYDYVYFRNSSVNYVNDSYFGNLVSFEGSSNSTLSGCRLEGVGNVYFRENSKVNFVYTNITKASYFYNTPSIFGSVNFSAASIFSGSAARYYPILVRYSGTGNSAANKTVNITNSTNIIVWNSTTNTYGSTIANLTFNTANYGNGNFTISVNPSLNISLSTKTPIIFDISDSESPTWYNNETSPDSDSFYDNLTLYQLIISWTDNNAISNVWFEANFSGAASNYTASNSGNTYYYNFQSLAAGNYQWRSYANDTSGNLNQTDLWIYSVSKSSGKVFLLLNGTSGNLSMIYSSSINASASTQYGSVALYRDGNDITSAENNNYVLLGVGYYNYTAVSTGNQNYSQASITYFVNITRADSEINLTLNNVRGNISVNTNDNININASLILPLSGLIEIRIGNNTINRGNSPLSNSTSFSSAGIYNVSVFYNTTQNYSSSTVIYYITVSAPSEQQPSGGGGNNPGGGAAPFKKSNETIIIVQKRECAENWNCSDWTGCMRGIQTRLCNDINNCGSNINKPSESQSCEMLAIEVSKKFNLLWAVAIALLVLIMALLWWLRQNRLEILIKAAENAIKHKKFDKAKKLYRKIHEIYMKLSHEEKEKYHAKILRIYNHLKS